MTNVSIVACLVGYGSWLGAPPDTPRDTCARSGEYCTLRPTQRTSGRNLIHAPTLHARASSAPTSVHPKRCEIWTGVQLFSLISALLLRVALLQSGDVALDSFALLLELFHRALQAPTADTRRTAQGREYGVWDRRQQTAASRKACEARITNGASSTRRNHAWSNVRVSHVILDEFDAFGHVVLHLDQLLLDEDRTYQLED